MILELDEVIHIAELARLELTSEELALYRRQLSSILEHVAQLQAVDTQHIPPTSGVLPERTLLRPDEPSGGLELAALLRNAPQAEDDQFRVPPVLD